MIKLFELACQLFFFQLALRAFFFDFEVRFLGTAIILYYELIYKAIINYNVDKNQTFNKIFYDLWLI